MHRCGVYGGAWCAEHRVAAVLDGSLGKNESELGAEGSGEYLEGLMVEQNKKVAIKGVRLDGSSCRLVLVMRLPLEVPK